MYPVKGPDGFDEHEAYPCSAVCFNGEDPYLSQMSHWRCSLAWFPRSRWQSGSTPLYYMGRLPIVGQDIPSHYNPRKPPEDHEDGCPGGWYRCAFVESLCKYERMFSGGMFSANVMLDRTSDPLIIEATQYLEHQRLRYRAHAQEVMNGSK